MCIDEIIEQLKDFVLLFWRYKENEFDHALISTKEISFDMDIELKFHEKYICHIKK